MKLLWRYCAVIWLPVFLSNCSTLPTPDSYNQEAFALGNKGIAILYITEHAADAFNKTNISLPYRLKKFGKNEILHIREQESLIPIGLYNPHNYSSNVMMLDPGVYYINHLTLNRNGNFIRWYSGPGIKKVKNNHIDNKYLVTIGAFEVKPGKVSYFGHAHLPHLGELPFKIINEMEQVKADLKEKGLNELAEKVEWQPFYQAGSVIIKKDGKFSFIAYEEIEARRLELLNAITNDLAKKRKK